MIRVTLPHHLRLLANTGEEVSLELRGAATIDAILDALEDRYPMLRGTIRDQTSGQRRAFVRLFACQEDVSHEPSDSVLPSAIASGREPLMIVGAIAGG